MAVRTEKIVTYTCDICGRVRQQDEMSRVHLDVSPHGKPEEGMPSVVMGAADVCAGCIGTLSVARLLDKGDAAHAS